MLTIVIKRVGVNKKCTILSERLTKQEHSSMERDEDAGITKDSSQEIEGLLEKEKQAESGRLLPLMFRETRWLTRLEARITIGLSPHLHPYLAYTWLRSMISTMTCRESLKCPFPML